MLQFTAHWSTEKTKIAIIIFWKVDSVLKNVSRFIWWAKKEDVEVDTLSEWIKSIADVLKRRIRRLKHSVNTRHESIFSDPDVVRELSRLHENFVIAPADKASNNYTFVCKRHYVSVLSEELRLNSLPGNPTYYLTDLSASEVLDNHKSVLTSFGIETSDDELDLPYIQGVSENMQQLLISTKIGCKPGQIKIIHQIQAYNHTILLIIKNPETDTK